MVDFTHNGGPPLEDEPTHTARRARRDPWFKFYPADWLRDTRHLTLEQRGAYIDAIAIQMESGESMPDDVSWLAHQMHISTRKARTLVQQLVDAKKLLRKDGQLTNNRCEKEIAEREAQRVKVSHSASVRERTKREPALNQAPVNVEPELNRAPVKLENPEFVNEINETSPQKKHGAGPTRTGAHARLELEIEKEKKESTQPLPSNLDAGVGGGSGVVPGFESLNGTAVDLIAFIGKHTRTFPDEAQRMLSTNIQAFGARPILDAFVRTQAEMSSGGVVAQPYKYLISTARKMRDDAAARATAGGSQYQSEREKRLDAGRKRLEGVRAKMEATQ